MERLLYYLKRHSVSQQDLAAALGVTQATISRIALGRSKPSLALAVKIERETGGVVRPCDFIERDGPRPAAKQDFHTSEL